MTTSLHHTPLRRTVLALAVLAGTAACSRQTADPSAAPQPLPVRVARVTMADVQDGFEAGGVVQSRTTALLTSRILAAVRDVRVAPGDRVRAGQVLVVLDGRDLAAYAEGARAGAVAASQAGAAALSDERAAAAALVLARATHDRIAGLVDRRSATPQERDEAVAALRAAEARAEAASARVRQASAEIEGARAAGSAAAATASFTRITAPFAGVVTEKLVEPGNMASPGTPLLRLEDEAGFRIELRIDESRVSGLSNGQRVLVTIESAAAGETPVDGTITEIGRALDADTRAFLVKVELPRMPDLRSGMFGRARFALRPRRVLTVPPEAIVRQGQLTSVFVVDGGIARLRLVNARGAEILAGLQDGEIVIVAPGPGVVDGRAVQETGQ